MSPAEALTQRSNSLDQARSNLFTTVGTTSDTKSHETIEALPQGANAPVERVLLQAPGVSQDSAASGLFHIRNDHANAQYRINGVFLPEGVTGFGSILDTNFVGNLSLVTGALPAEYGLRTTGIIDLTTRNDIFNNTGSINYYFGSRETIQPSFEYGGTFGANCPGANSAVTTKSPVSSSATCFGGVQYYFTGNYLQTNEGIENPTPFLNPVHDFSRQERGFAYLSTFLDPYTRLSLIAGTYTANFQIPNVFNAPISGAITPPIFGASTFDSSKLNERQNEDTQFGVLALQRSINGFDGQLSYFTRYSNLHFIPDPLGDLLLNGVASDVSRQSYTNGFAGDASYVINPAHTLRAGFTVSAEQSSVDNTSLVQSTSSPPSSAPVGSIFPITDDVHKVGWLAGVYAQDEWKITDKLTLNAGLRFDQMWQFVTANQLSPRASLTYKPFDGTTFHAGYARYFTPPVLVEAAAVNFALFNGTSAAVTNPVGSPVLPERSHYFDAGLDQKIPFGCYTAESKGCTTLDLGIDAYYKVARDLIDNGQFGQALVLSAFNYEKGVAQGVEFSAKFHSGNFQAYANLAVSQEKATQPVSNQFLFDNATPLADLGGLTQFQYLSTHWIYTDHNQFVTGSAGLSYKWNGTTFSTDMVYGSGLRNGDANIDALAPYAQFNVGLKRDFAMADGGPVTVRFDVVNVFDTVYQIRNGTGIGVFAPQYGPRRGYFIGIKKKICADPNSSDCRNIMRDDGRDAARPFKWPSAPVTDHYNWSGFYLGLNAGAAFGVNTMTASAVGSASVKEPGFIGGAQFGANYQTGSMVWGFEADYDASTQNKSLPAGVLTGSASQTPWFATLRGRVGLAFDRTLLYGTAGGAAGELRSIATIPAGATSTTVTYGTWTAGGGVEYGITDNLSARLEYLYLDKSHIATGVIGPPATTITSRVQDNMLRAGLNYRFSILQ